jgi:hypothetical protein
MARSTARPNWYARQIASSRLNRPSTEQIRDRGFGHGATSGRQWICVAPATLPVYERHALPMTLGRSIDDQQ